MEPSVDYEEIENYLSQFGDEGDIVLLTQYYDKGVAVLLFDNPDKKNALTGSMMVKFRKIIEELEQWKEGKAVLLCGKGGNFCSGGDLSFARLSGNRTGALHMSNWMQDTLKRLRNLPMFSVCLVEGPTLGGGAEIVSFCDFVLVSENVKLGFVQGKMGILTAWGGGSALVRKIGYKKALDVFLTSRILNASACLEYGIADHVVSVDTDGGSLLEKALEWIEPRLVHHYSIVRDFKRVVLRAASDRFERSLEFEKDFFSHTWGSELNMEALNKKIKHVNNGAKM